VTSNVAPSSQHRWAVCLARPCHARPAWRDGVNLSTYAPTSAATSTTGDPSILDYELYGVSPFVAGVSGDSGAYNDFNGALVEFDDAYNVYSYAFQNGGALDPTAADFFGTPTHIADALGRANAMDAADYFLQPGPQRPQRLLRHHDLQRPDGSRLMS